MILKCGNCLNLLKELPSESVDMVMTSPPYDNLRDYHGYSFDFEDIARELYRVMKAGGVIVWVVSDAVIDGSENVKTYGDRFNVWNIPSEKANKSGHPAVYPVRLYKDHIYTWSNQDDVVLDPFMGSGTTGIACKELGREFIGFEISIDYFKIASKRISEYDAQIGMEDVIYNKKEVQK